MMQMREQHQPQAAHSASNAGADTLAFVTLINSLHHSSTLEARELFDSEAKVFITRAPGRLDVMGGIADYSGSLVLQMPIAEATHVALQALPQSNTTPALKILSLSQDGGRESFFEMPFADFEQSGEAINYQAARSYFDRDESRSWAAYAAGAFLVLMRERGAHFEQDVRILISSGVPEGKGVSSSAAIEVAVMSAVCAAYGIEIAPRDLALLCQKLENAIVGAPCGVMDQTAVACGKAGELLALLCQPAELQGTVKLPSDLAVWGIDSGVRHSVGGGDYGSVRTGAFMGYRIIAEVAKLRVEAQDDGRTIHIDDTSWNGFLSNVTPSEFESTYVEHLPPVISGDEFLARFQGTTDAVTRIDPARTYTVRDPTAHAIYEHFRVRAFAELLHASPSQRRDEVLGELMYQSHASYGRCGLGSEGTDLLVQLVRESGMNENLFGAKITGGGSGGTVAVLGRKGADESIRRIASEYHRATKHEPYIFNGSSQGSAAFGFIKLDNPATIHVA